MTSLARLLTVLALVAAADAKTPDLPPSTRLKDQAVLVETSLPADVRIESSVMLIERGFDMIRLKIESAGRPTQHFAYDEGQKRIVATSPVQQPDRPAKPQPAPPTPPEGVKASHYDRWVMNDPWRRIFAEAKREDLLAIGHLESGFACIARNGTSPAEPATLLVDRSPTAPPIKLRSLEAYKGQVFHRVYLLRLMRSGDVVVIAGQRQGHRASAL